MGAQFADSSRFKKTLLAVGIGVACYTIVSHLRAISHKTEFASVLLTGTHHMGENFNIADFYVDGYSGFNVVRGGGGGSNVCCVNLPQVWRPGLNVDLRWTVGDWTNENLVEIGQHDYRSVRFQSYRGTIPVEQYRNPEHLFVHFFSGGKARIVSSSPGVGNEAHPIANHPHESKKATAGLPVDSLFSQAELDRRRAKRAAEKEKSGGDWK